MPVWFVVYIVGKLAIVAGPLPNTTVCLAQAQTMSAGLDSMFSAKGIDVYSPGRKLGRADVVATCISSGERPK